MNCKQSGNCGCHNEHSHHENHEHENHDHHDHNHNCEGGCGGCQGKEITLSKSEIAMLVRLAEIPFLPLARFVLKSTKSDHFECLALAPIHMLKANDTREIVTNTGKLLTSLEEKGLLSLDYENPLVNGDYSIYEKSALYANFIKTVEEAKGREGFIFDIPVLELGSIALTPLGQNSIEELEHR